MLPTFETKGGVTDASLYGAHVADCTLEVRLGFIRKVFSIVALQLLCTMTISALVFLSPSLRLIVQEKSQIAIFSMIMAFGLLFATISFRHQSPVNMQLLAAFTVSESIAIATALAPLNGEIVIQAAVVTAAVVAGLVCFTFQTKRDFTPINSLLVTTLWVCLGMSILQIMMPMPDTVSLLLSGLGAGLFSLFIIVDVQMMMTKLSTDEYILCAINLYLDVLNLFLEILRIMNRK